MDIKAFAKEVVNDFFVIYFCVMLGNIVWMRFWVIDSMSWHGMIAFFVMSLLISLTGFVMYSSKGLKRHKLLIRHTLHLLLIIVIYLFIGSYMGWIQWSEPIHLISLVGLIISIYVVVLAIRFYQSKKQMDEMNEMLKELNKK